jgi:hypothetical protein
MSRSILRDDKSSEGQPICDIILFRYHNGVKVQDTAKYQVGYNIYHILNPFECRMSTWVFILRSSYYGGFASFKIILIGLLFVNLSCRENGKLLQIVLFCQTLVCAMILLF